MYVFFCFVILLNTSQVSRDAFACVFDYQIRKRCMYELSYYRGARTTTLVLRRKKANNVKQ